VKMSTNFSRYNQGNFNSGTYTPGNKDILDVSKAVQATVTTSSDHGYTIGNLVQFNIPAEWGMRQLSGKKGCVISLPSEDQFVVDINTTTFDSFVTPAPPTYVVVDNAQVAAIGDNNAGPLSPGGVVVLPTTIPGAYINTRP
jgi:hypothetical protein